jgi:hypothetical protein
VAVVVNCFLERIIRDVWAKIRKSGECCGLIDKKRMIESSYPLFEARKVADSATGKPEKMQVLVWDENREMVWSLWVDRIVCVE